MGRNSKPRGSLAQKLHDVGKHTFALAYLSKRERKPELLLAPNIPYPLHEVAPRTVLGPTWWNKERKAAYASTSFRCLACGVPKYCASYHQWLEGHETYQIDYAKGTATYLRTVPLCHFCHSYIHDGRLEILLAEGEIHHAKYVNIILHGDKVLADAGLRKPSREQRANNFAKMVSGGLKLAKWEDWRLVIGKKTYRPKYKTYKDWCLARGYSVSDASAYMTSWLKDEDGK